MPSGFVKGEWLVMNKKKSRKTVLLFVMLIFIFVLAGCNKEKVKKSEVYDVDSMAGQAIGVQIGTIGEIYASDYEELGSKVVSYNKGSDAILALKQGKIECVIIDSEPAKKFVEYNSDLSILETEFVIEEYAVCIAKENTELLDKLNWALSQIIESGEMKKIIDNYIGDDALRIPYEQDKSIEHNNGMLVMATNAEFEPYEYVKDDCIIGIDVDMMKKAADILGMELVINDMGFDSIISAVASGKADVGASGFTVTEERLKNINFSIPYTTAKQVIIVRNGNNSIGNEIVDKFKQNFIVEGRWKYIVSGLWTTIKISFFACIIGAIFGFIIAIARFSCDKTKKCSLLNWILKAYINIIRGTPAMIQLLIIYYVVFASSNINAVIVAIIAFGLNSSAYVSEVVRSGLSSVDEGQFEAGRSLGFNYVQTMRYFILPQAVKNILPSLANEFIVLLKETSIAGYIGIRDLTRAGDLIRGRTYDAFMPLIAVAIIYLVIVLLLSYLVGRLERRMNKDDSDK